MKNETKKQERRPEQNLLTRDKLTKNLWQVGKEILMSQPAAVLLHEHLKTHMKHVQDIDSQIRGDQDNFY